MAGKKHKISLNVSPSHLIRMLQGLLPEASRCSREQAESILDMIDAVKRVKADTVSLHARDVHPGRRDDRARQTRTTISPGGGRRRGL